MNCFAKALFSKFSPSLSQTRRTYLAAVLHDFQKPLVVENVQKDPEIGKSQVLVKVDAAGVNHADLMTVRGQYHTLPPLPIVPGFELAGEIIAKGAKVQNFNVGDRVLALKTDTTGAFAQKCIVDENELYGIPHSLGFETAVSIPVAYGTALLALRDVAKVTEGKTVLVLTSQGSTGLAAIDLSLNFFKCQVIAACDTEAKCGIVREMGVLATCEYTDENLIRTVKKHTEKKGVDVVVDTVGGLWFGAAIKCLKPGGILLAVGHSSGQAPTVNAQTLISLRVSVAGVSLGGLAKATPHKFHNIIEQIVKLLDGEYISPYTGKQFALKEVNQAIEHVDGKSSIGKIILITR